MKKGNVIALALAILMISPSAFATKIFLNGVEITGVKNKTFKKATVRIDANGDIHLDAPQYEVRVLEDKQKPTQNVDDGSNPELTNQYFLATQGNSKMAQYDLVISVNGVERKIIPAGSSSVIEEISSWLKKGKNTIQVVAKKNLVEGRKSTATSDSLTLVVGIGHEEGKIVKIDSVKASFKCNASQLSDITKTYTVVAK